MHRQPASQGKALLAEKEAVARHLLAQGLTITQVTAQLRCSRHFVLRVSKELRLQS